LSNANARRRRSSSRSAPPFSLGIDAGFCIYYCILYADLNNDNGGNDQQSDGHLQEPALFIPAMVRAFGGTMNDQNYYSSDLANLGQDLFNPASVFNYYSPGYGVAGTGGLKGPEFQIDTPNNAIVRANLVANLFSQYSNPVQSYGPGTTIDLTPFLPLASTPATLVNALDLTLTHGVMPGTIKTAIVNAVAADALGTFRSPDIPPARIVRFDHLG
jgi:hypothetical protein